MGKAVERYQPRAIERLGVNQVQAIAHTELIPKNLRGNVPAIMATILKGRALGLDDMHALTAIHFIEGKPTTSAETMVMLARRAGHSITGEYGDGRVTVRGKRGDTDDEMSVTWTLEMAHRAGLVNKDNWKRYPEAMLWARGVSQLCRMLFADVLAGVGYTPEEVERSPEERVADAIGEVGPPRDTSAPDDTAPTERAGNGPGGPRDPGATEPSPVPGPARSLSDDDPDETVVEGHAVLVDEPDGEPKAAAPSAVSSAVSPPAREPGSPSETPQSPQDPAPQPARTGGRRATATPEGAGEPDAEGQGSIFADMAEKAQRKSEHKDPAA